VLSGSSWSGKATKLNINCKQFLRATKLGLGELYVYDDNQPVLWRDDARTYVTAAVPSDDCIETAADAIRIESAKTSETAAPLPLVVSYRHRRKLMSRSPRSSSCRRRLRLGL
jgi:hypothetical protein